jgi:SAM-dependent methyltransferase
MQAWYEDDRFWETFAAVMFTEQRWSSAPIEIDWVLHLLEGVYPGMAVLDLCCGPGRHSLELKRRGFRVTGVDRTALYLDEARRRAHEEGLAVEFVQDDMRHFVRPGAFSAALSMYTSFGYFSDPADNLQVLANIYQSLKPGGALLMEMNGKEVLASG